MKVHHIKENPLMNNIILQFKISRIVNICIFYLARISYPFLFSYLLINCLRIKRITFRDTSHIFIHATSSVLNRLFQLLPLNSLCFILLSHTLACLRTSANELHLHTYIHEIIRRRISRLRFVLFSCIIIR